MKYLVTGVSGQLGYDIVRELTKRGVEYKAVSRNEMNITDRGQVLEVITKYHPDVIIHCAAWTAVDKAEEEKDNVMITNVNGTQNIVDSSIEIGAKLMYISTDYVFDGTKEGYYTELDECNPKNVYGLSKLLGEQAVMNNPKHFIARISWVFGINGNNFVKTMLKLSDKYKELNVVCDQVGSPTYTVDVSKLLIDMTDTDKYGIYHVNNDGYCSWAEFADYIFKSNNIDVKVNYVTTEEYLNIIGTCQAYRPRNSKLSKDKLISSGFTMLPSWKDATDRYCEELRENKVLTKRR